MSDLDILLGSGYDCKEYRSIAEDRNLSAVFQVSNQDGIVYSLFS